MSRFPEYLEKLYFGEIYKACLFVCKTRSPPCVLNMTKFVSRLIYKKGVGNNEETGPCCFNGGGCHKHRV